MDSIRAWVATLCAACIAAGILQQLSIRRSGFSVIKLVLALYILITAFEPIRSVRTQEEWFSVPNVDVQAAVPDVEAASIRTAENTLEKMLAGELTQAGIPAKHVTVILEQINDSLTVNRVELELAAKENAESVQKAVRRFFGIEVPVIIRKEELK